jgi:LysM repeat protein
MRKTSIIARVLAALALAGSVAAVLIVVNSETGDDGARPSGGNQGKPAKAKPNANGGQQNEFRNARVYVVKEGDSLTAIAVKTGVPIETIEVLNPDVDPQALIPGQKLKLR